MALSEHCFIASNNTSLHERTEMWCYSINLGADSEAHEHHQQRLYRLRFSRRIYSQQKENLHHIGDWLTKIAVAAANVSSQRLPALLRQHDLVDEVDNGGGRLLGVQLCEHVANVLGQAAGLLGYETKHPESREEDLIQVTKPGILSLLGGCTVSL